MSTGLVSHRIVDLPWTGSLYETSSDQIVGKLEELAAQISANEIVILRITGDSHDYSLSWLESLRTEAMWVQLEKRFTNLHNLFYRIIVSKGKWFFLSGGDCVGSWWELALACHGRVFTNPFAKIGFPEVYIDMFPPLGVLGLKKFSIYENAGILRQRAILNAKEGFKLGVVDLCLQSDQWIDSEALQQVFPWMARHRSRSESRSSVRSEYQREIPSYAQLSMERAKPEKRIEELEISRIDAAFAALKDRNYAVRARVLTAIRSGGAGRFLHPDYRAWLSRRVSRYRFGLHDRWWSVGSDVIVIRVDQGTPPQSVVVSMLLRRKKITFVAREAQQLKTALETIRARFDKRAEMDRDALDLWSQAVFWVCSSEVPESSVCCQFSGDNTVLISRGKICEKFYRRSGTFGHAATGWYEHVPSSSSSLEFSIAREDIDETVGLIANGILTSKWAKDVPLAVVLRQLLLEQLCRMIASKNNQLSMLGLLKLLAASGWGFASDVYQWDHLLKHFPVSTEILENFSELWGGSSNIIWLSVGLKSISGKEFEGIIQTSLANNETPFRAGAAFTQQLGVYAQMAAKLLVTKGMVASRDEADLFVTLAWGFPSMLPLPSSLVLEIGETRLKALAEGAGLAAIP